MKTMIPAAPGTFLLVPFLDSTEDSADTFYDKTKVPVLGWTNYSAAANDAPDLRTRAAPIVPFWPEGVSQAAGYLLPDGDGGYTIAVPFAKRTFTDMAHYDRFAEEMLRAMEEERNQEDAISGEAAARGAYTQDMTENYTKAQLYDEEFLSVELPTGTYRVSPAEDTREAGTTNAGGSRRTKEEIAADELFLEVVKGLGKTIRAVNSRWKKTPSRTAVLRDLAGKAGDEHLDADGVPATVTGDMDDDGEDLIG